MRGRRGGRRTLEERGAYPRPSDNLKDRAAATFAAPERLRPLQRFSLANSDIVSFHNYGNQGALQATIKKLRRYGRLLLCTEYMARPFGSTFDPLLEDLKRERVGAYNWGFVAGKTQTNYPWDSWEKTYTAEPTLWFHDIFRTDGTPYRLSEVLYIRHVTGRSAAPAVK